MNKLLIALFIMNFSITYGQLDIAYYLPVGVVYSDEIPVPKEVIGHEVGEWHISHDRLVSYMQALNKASERAHLVEIGQTFEGRPQLNLIITSPENHKNLASIKKLHKKLSDPAESDGLDLGEMPAVAYLGYSIHGNEPSGSNAALLVAYYLTSVQGDHIERILNETIIIIDPSFNPDGLNRFANYVNAHKSHNSYDDPNGLELNEPWPGGRTNHYWFDMNRDWLFAQLPESRNRIRRFQEWKPNLLTDHHEMGSNNTFFFQPGISSRNNPNTPAEVYRLTKRLGEFHAEALDSIGSLYYTQESYDDYYFGKGSSYPDINGGVGILFEQASSRGHIRETDHGILTFPFTIRNQFNTTLSSLEGLNKMRIDFLNHQRTFYKDALNEAKRSSSKAIIFGSKDRSRNYHLAEILTRHDIRVFQSKKEVRIKGTNYKADEVFIVPSETEKFRLLKTMFDTNTTFQDSLFYDVSTWTLPLAFNVDYDWVTVKELSDSKGEVFKLEDKPKGNLVGGTSAYAYAFEWQDYYTPKLLNKLLSKEFKVKVANEEFISGNKNFSRGSILIPVSIQKWSPEQIADILKDLVSDTGANIYSLNSGLNYETFSLGSPMFRSLEKPSIAMLVGDGVRPYDAGEVWHLFDQRFDIEMAMLHTKRLNRISLDRYNTLILVNGSYSGLGLGFSEKLKSWVRNGGIIIASQGALKYLNKIGLGKFEFVKKNNLDSVTIRLYEDINEYNGAQQIGGAIFKTKIDLTNPLFYGYYSNYLPVFKNTEDFMTKGTGSYSNPMVYTDSPLISGYISKENLNLLKKTSALGLSSYGKGKVIGFSDNLNFRAIFYGTNKLFMNAIYFGRDINSKADR